MPVYECLQGDWSNVAIGEPGSFVLTDALGRNWICRETDLSEVPADPWPMLAPLARVQKLARKQGLDTEGSILWLLGANDTDELTAKLAVMSYPPAAESANLLRGMGWPQMREVFGTGSKVRVTASNGHDTVEAVGDNSDEAWYRVMLKALHEKPPMIPPIQPDPLPLRADDHGAIYVGDSRVLLDVAVHEFENGASPEEIVHAYPTLQLADVYAVISYYLRHPEEVKSYLVARGEAAEQLRRKIEAEHPGRENLRAKLLARREQMEQGHASTLK
jgi:uncharacterized protein (DUF433 family)